MYARNRSTKKVTAPDTETTSDRFEVLGNRGSYQLPAGLDGTSAQFQGSVDGETFTDIGAADTVAANESHPIPADVFGFPFARIVLAAQTGDAEVLLFMAGDG